MIDDIQINSDGAVFWKEVETETLEKDEVIITKCHRSSVLPGSFISDLPEEVKKVCEDNWTPEVIQSWKNKVEK
jgi:hypothetical protein